MNQIQENLPILETHLSAIWSLLNERERELLAINFNLQQYKKNQIIYCEGEKPDYLLCLISGKVKIYKDGVGGRSQIIRLIRPVQYFAYRAFFAQEEFVTSAAAFESSTVAYIPMEVIEQLILGNNRLALFFIKELSIDLGIVDARTVTLTQKHIRGRLAESLLFLLENYGLEEDGATINIYMAREDLASLSNMTTSNAIRTLTCFANESIINVDGRRIQIVDIERLKKINRFG